MPPVVAAIGWIGSAIGSISIGSGFIGAVVTGAVKGAIIGAVVGGATAAISGGDIGDGMLKGAVGGALTGGVMGGVSHAMNAAKSAQAIDNIADLESASEVGKASEMLSAPDKLAAARDQNLLAGGDLIEGPPVPTEMLRADPSLAAGAGGSGQKVISPEDGQMTDRQFMAAQRGMGEKEMYIQGGMALAEGALGTYQQEKMMEAQLAADKEAGGVLAGDYRAGFSGKGANIPAGGRVGPVRRPGASATSINTNIRRPTPQVRNVNVGRA